MGFPPPQDAPPPAEQDAAGVDAGFQPSPTGNILCGFGVPTFSLSIRLPAFRFPPFAFPPQLNFGIALNCSLSDPIDAQFGFGGGRVPNFDPDSDDEYAIANPPGDA